MDFNYILSKQNEWRKLFKEQDKKYKLEKNREEKKRAKQNKNLSNMYNAI